MMLRTPKRSPFILMGLLLTTVILAIFFLRRQPNTAFGATSALCPGPDHYGYTCTSGAGFAYIDATNDTFLYADDGTTTLPLPFPFTFYGTPYTEVTLSSNGNVQFGNANPVYSNTCLKDAPAMDMGDMIAPYWDDLDLTFFGFLEYETVGEAPQRIFVLEWDGVPYFGGTPEDTVTFELQLFEESNDILFLYQDVVTTEAFNGNSATIGIQSEAQGVTLQYGCNQPVIANSSGLYLPHPDDPNNDLGLEVILPPPTHPTHIIAKGVVADVTTQLQPMNGTDTLNSLRLMWRNQPTPLTTEWAWANLTGDAQKELILLWHGPPTRPDLTQLAVFTLAQNGRFTPLFTHHFTNRIDITPQNIASQNIASQNIVSQIEIAEIVDLTNDDYEEVLIHAPITHQHFILTTTADMFEVITLPEKCTGKMGVLDVDENGRLDIVRNDCNGKRMTYTWNGQAFLNR